MILKMRKLNLAALSCDRDGILNALQRTNAVEVKEHAEAEGTAPLSECGEELRAYLSSLEMALETLVPYAGKGKNSANDDSSVSYEEFYAAAGMREEMDSLMHDMNALKNEINTCIAENARMTREISAATAYGVLQHTFDSFADTSFTKTCLGTVPAAYWDSAKKTLDEIPLCAYNGVTNGDGVVLSVTAHKSIFAEVESLLTGFGFSLCPYSGNITGEKQLSDLKAQLKNIQERQLDAENGYSTFVPQIRNLKIYCDYVRFQLDKAEATGKMRGTEHTFFLEAFVPANEEQNVISALEKSEFTVWYEFSDPAGDEQVPTLMKNNAVVSNFESITNMYSPPSPREFDPNTVMAFFYSLFLGFIMADIGYGILMLVGGGILWYKNRSGSGIKSLSGVFAIGGIFTVIWGFLFNSLFGIQILPFTVMPDAQGDMYTFVGIKIPSVLIIAMLIGVIQLFAGYICKAVQEWRRGNILDGLFGGVIWAIFSLGVGAAVLGLVEDFGLPSMLTTVGGIVAGASLLIAALTAGRKEKLLGKFTKGFGSLYGIINYVSDILSYARLYGLMLSGAIIAQIVSQYSIQFITGGNVIMAIVGIILMVVGHGFNLAIGLLGAYIHDARLQYVEFYGRFFEGEGELFAPLGSNCKHIYIDKEKI